MLKLFLVDLSRNAHGLLHLLLSPAGKPILSDLSTSLRKSWEHDHRFIKRLVKPGLGFWSFDTAWRTLQGYEVRHMLRKGQVKGVDTGASACQAKFIARLFGVAA